MAHQIKWLGHAACQITTEKNKVILIDPWITGNPSCPITKDDIKQADIILVTHDHFDHLGTDIPYLTQNTQATVVGQPELISFIKEAASLGENMNTITMNIGGQVEVAGIKITMTQALHSSSHGSPVGYMITLENDQTIYHAGDTGIFASMQLFGDLYNIDLALLPIGSVYVMDPQQAAVSLTLLRPKMVVPIHYRTFPALTQEATGFVKLARQKAPDVQVKVLEPGEEVLI